MYRLHGVMVTLAFALALPFSPNTAHAQKIYAVLAADTTDGSIGAGITENLQNIKGFLQIVHSLTNIDVPITEVSSNNFNCKNIETALNGVNPSANDVVLFYYSGHGFRRTSDQSKFPEFDCRRTTDPDEVDLSGTVFNLQNKRPRFILALADTCNVVVPSFPVPAAAAIAPPDQVRKAALLHLFEDYNGTLMMSGAVPGEFSWYMTAGSGLGGFFTNQLLKVINEKLGDGPKIRWEDVATDATKPIFVPTQPSPSTQNPQYAALNLVVAKAAP
jgi:hypothetical protein